MQAFPKLATTWTLAHAADQLLLAWLPLVLVANGVGAGVVSSVVAAHAAAWLIVSLPVGAYADAISRRRIMMLGAAGLGLGAVVGFAGMAAVGPAPALLAVAAFLTAAGVVAVVLSIFALLPQTVASARLPRANALLELLRAVACIVMPFVAARLVGSGAFGQVFLAIAVAALIALAAASRLATETRGAGLPLGQAMRDGMHFVAREPLLKAIALCAIAWNAAFFALTAVFAPYATQRLDFSIAQAAEAWSVYGIGLILGALAAPVMIGRLATGFMFVFGPALSATGVALLVAMGAGGGRAAVWFAFFALGFGPMTWLVLQTSVRQIVTPTHLLGRVGAVITTAIYGVRPLGALAAGGVASLSGLDAAMALAAALFIVSLAVIAVSPAARLQRMPAAAERLDLSRGRTGPRS